MLRPYQQTAVKNVKKSYLNGKRAPLFVLSTGGGKTFIFSHIARNASYKDKRVLILVHRVELLRQTSKSLSFLDVEHGLINPKYTPERGAMVQVASVQTLVRRLKNIIPPDLIIIDECFPGGTLIDGKPISKFVVGDTVKSFNHEKDKIEYKVVRKIHERDYFGDWYKFKFTNGKTFIVTENHPIYVCGYGYVKAKNIKYISNKYLLKFITDEGYLPELRKRDKEKQTRKEEKFLRLKMFWSKHKKKNQIKIIERRKMQSLQKNNLLSKSKISLTIFIARLQLLLNRLFEKIYIGIVESYRFQYEQKICFKKNEEKQSDVQRGVQKENAEKYAGKNFFIQRWKRATNKATKSYTSKNRAAYGIRNFCMAFKGTIRESSQVLQGRFSLSRSEASNRSGWKESSFKEVEVFGQTENSNARGLRMASYKVYKRGSGRKPNWVPSENKVYNLHVEDNLNYFAENVLVHNCHHAVAGSWDKIVSYFPDAKILGVTATPCRGDGKGLGVIAGGLFDDLITGPQTPELIEMGFLVQPKVYAPKNNLDLSKVHTRMGDYDKKEINELMDRPTITGDAVSHYSRLCPGVPAVAFCVSIKHAEHVAQQFQMAGYRAYAVSGETDDDLRDRLLAGLGDGTVDLIASCDLISEGTDIPAIGCAILLRPTQSLGLYIQQVGRALRPSEGKKNAIILDHVGNVLNHGMPDDERTWTLEGKKRRRGAKNDEPTVLVTQCEECFAVYHPAPVCPECGHRTKKNEREPEQVDGELEEIKREQIKKEKKIENYQAGSYSELAELARKRGYKPGWAKNYHLNRRLK